jgi:beta-galactosidase
MKILHCLLRMLPAVLLLALVLSAPVARAAGWPGTNDAMFPPAPAAKPFIDIDGRGFLIHGRRVFIVAGELQYTRTPRALWRDRLLRIKRAGYNTIQTYAFWNFHEPREGRFDFTSDNHDLDSYLKLIHSLGMYAIVRVGPYINAEWDTGGLPVWLRFKPGLRPLKDNAPFYAAVTPYWDRLFPIVVRNQITQGGAVIMVQLDNEHTFDALGGGLGSGTDLPDAFYRHFQRVTQRAGVVVPYFFSGLNHSDDPAGDGPLDTATRTTPWYSTEFWTGWYGWYGVSPEKHRKVVRATWKILAYGGAGYTHYTMAGGSDFDTWNNNEQAASYDFGSPIGQAGDLRSDYYPLKRAALFAAAFPLVLADSVASEGATGITCTNPAVRLTSRKNKAGRILFLDNPGGQRQSVQVKAADGTLTPGAGPIRMEEGEIVPIVLGYPLLPDVTLTMGAARILGTATQSSTTTLVIYGAPGEPGDLHFRVPARGVTVGQKSTAAGDSLVAGHGTVTLKTVFPTGAPKVFTFQVGARTVRVLSERSDLADRTWFVPVDGRMEIVCGPDYVGEAGLHAGRLALQTEQKGLSGPSTGPCWVFTANQQITLGKTTAPGMAVASGLPPALGPWRADASVPQAQSGFDDQGWLRSDQPRPMGADGDNSAYAWYRTKVTPPAPGDYQLDISDYSDWLTAFVDGKRVGSGDVHRTTSDDMTPRPQDCRMTVHLGAGPHTIALLTAHYGRNKLVTYYGPLDTIDSKGVTGQVTLTQESVSSQDIPVFRWKADDGPNHTEPNDAATLAAPSLAATGADWQDAHAYDDVFHGRLGYAWFRATLPIVPGPHRRLTFASIDDLGTVYLNGKQIAVGIGINADAPVSLDSAWNPKGPNVLAVLVQNTAGGGGLGKVTLSGGLTDGVVLHGWRMHGGEVPPGPAPATWKPLAVVAATGVPCWYRTAFTANPPAPNGPHPILRVQTSTLTRGFVWLNGHNLGRYPEVSRDASGTGQLVDGVYLPECWLRPGRNELMVFDEEGVAPSKVKIVVEQAASRQDVSLTTQVPLSDDQP